MRSLPMSLRSTSLRATRDLARGLAHGLVLAMTLGAVGCAGGAGGRPDALPLEGPLPEGAYDVQRQARVEPDALVERLHAARYVIIGETHTERWHHETQLVIWRALQARQEGLPVHLGMEMFQSPFQEVLSDYVGGRISEQAMLEQTEYMDRWRFDPSLYSPLWRHAHQSHVALLALNAPRELTRAVARSGIEGLEDQALRAQLPGQLWLDDQGHRGWMRQIFAQHGGQMDDATFERFYQAQVTWDETMAERAFTFMQQRPAHERLVIVAGSGHVLNRYGIPSRIERRIQAQATPDGQAPDRVLTVICVTLTDEEPWTAQRLRDYKAERFADFVWVQRAPTQPLGASPHGDQAAPAHPPAHPPTHPPAHPTSDKGQD